MYAKHNAKYIHELLLQGVNCCATVFRSLKDWSLVSVIGDLNVTL